MVRIPKDPNIIVRPVGNTVRFIKCLSNEPAQVEEIHIRHGNEVWYTVVYWQAGSRVSITIHESEVISLEADEHFKIGFKQ